MLTMWESDVLSFKDLENNISAVLNKEKASKAIRRYVEQCICGTWLVCDRSYVLLLAMLCFTTGFCGMKYTKIYKHSKWLHQQENYRIQCDISKLRQCVLNKRLWQPASNLELSDHFIHFVGFWFRACNKRRRISPEGPYGGGGSVCLHELVKKSSGHTHPHHTPCCRYSWLIIRDVNQFTSGSCRQQNSAVIS